MKQQDKRTAKHKDKQMDDQIYQLELLCLCGEKTLDGYFVCKECLEEEMKEAWGDE